MTDRAIDFASYIPPESELHNQDLVQSVDERVLPLTNNLVNGFPQGDVHISFSTGESEFIDLPKSYIAVKYTVAADAGAAGDSFVEHVAPCLWSSGRFEIEGQRISQSNNYTFDWALSNRMQYSADFNKAMNSMSYKQNADITVVNARLTEPATASSSYISIDNMAAFFVKTPNLLLPPNCHYRYVLTPEVRSTFLQKCSTADTQDATAARLEVTIDSITLHLHRIKKSTRPEGDYTLRILNFESNPSLPTGLTHQVQYQISTKAKKVGCALVSTADTTAAAVKVYAPWRFRFANDLASDAIAKLGTVGTNGITKLQFRNGSLNMPLSAYDFGSASNLKEAYLDFLNATGKYNDSGNPETLAEYLRQGPIFLQDMIKGPLDLSTNLTTEATFAAQPVARFYVFQLLENVINWTWEGPGNSIPVFKNLLT